MAQRVSITSSRFSHDMAGWCQEKAMRLVESIAHMFDSTRQLAPSEGEDADVLLEYLRDALPNAVELLAFAAGSEFGPADCDAIRQGGYEGFCSVAAKYGLINETQKDALKSSKFADEFRELLRGQRAPGRTLINELLDKLGKGHIAYRDLSRLTNDLNLRKIEWSAFVPEAQVLLQRHFPKA